MKKIVALVLSLVMVLGLATTAFAAPAEITFWGLDGDGKWAEMGVNYQEWIADQADDLDDLMPDDDNYLPCYMIAGVYYAEVKEAAAVNKLTYGAQTVYLVPADAEDFYFDEKAEVYTNVVDENDVCGTLYYALLDDEDVFYASYDKTTKQYTYYVANDDGADVVLVNGKLVEVDTLDYGLTGHNYVGNNVVNYVYTDVKCTNCGKVANLYANATAAGKLAQPVAGGWITFADMFTYGVTAAPEAGDKVESAETFDAGIAMYVGMSVMAAAGSAVVLKKKD